MIRYIRAPAGAVLEYIYLKSDRNVLRMREFMQHGRTSTYEHSIKVCLASCWIAGKLKCRPDTVRSVVRSAMLHDFYLYDYHGSRRANGRWHAWSHPETALRNALELFDLSEIERDAIRTHMFPGTILHAPRHAAGWIVSIADKVCAVAELLRIDAFRNATLCPA